MKAIAVTNEGFEDVCSLEITELCSSDKDLKLEQKNGIVIFETTKKNVMRVAYKTQASRRVLVYLGEFEFSDIEDFKTKSKVDYSKFFTFDKTFAVKAVKSKANSDLPSQDIERSIGHNVPCAVNLKNPDILIIANVVGNKCHYGIDVAGFDASKRYYKLFAPATSIKGNLAYFLVRRAGYSGSGVLLDPMAGAGTIPIEAAFMESKLSLNYYKKNDFKFNKLELFADEIEGFFREVDSERIKPVKKANILGYDNHLSAVNSIKKNSKIAGVSKFVSFGRGEVDWIDTKFKDEQVSHIVTNPPSFNRFNTNNIVKLYEQLFHRTRRILSEDGVMVILTNSKKPLDLLEEHGFVLDGEWTFFMGSNEKFIFRLLKDPDFVSEDDEDIEDDDQEMIEDDNDEMIEDEE